MNPHTKWMLEVKRRTGAKKVEVTNGMGHQILHLTCSHGHVVDFKLNGRAPSEFVAKQLIKAGWTIGNKLSCPEHSQPKKKKPAKRPAKKKQETQPMPSLASTPTPSPEPEATDSARQAKRRAMDWLSESFTASTGRYAEGVTDATIAKETGISEAKIKELREEFYGPLKEPAEIAEMRGELQALRDRLQDAETQFTSVVSRLVTDVSEQQRKLEKMCKANSW